MQVYAHESSLISDIAYNADGTLLAVALMHVTYLDAESYPGILLLDATHQYQVKRILRGHAGGITALAWRPGSDQLASGGADGQVRLWNPRTGAELAQFEYQAGGRVTTLAWDPTGTWLIAGGIGDVIRIWDVGRKALIHNLPRYGFTSWLGWSPDGKYITVMDTYYGLDQMDAISLQVACRFKVEDLPGYSFDVPELNSFIGGAWSPDSRLIAIVAVTDSGDIPFCEPNNPDLLFYIGDGNHLGDVESIAWSPNGHYLAAGTVQGKYAESAHVYIYDMKTRTLFRRIPIPRTGTKLAWRSNTELMVGCTTFDTQNLPYTAASELFLLTL
jgi:WD40 repeat protein